MLSTDQFTYAANFSKTQSVFAPSMPKASMQEEARSSHRISCMPLVIRPPLSAPSAPTAPADIRQKRPIFHGGLQNSQFSSTDLMAQSNFSRSVFEKNLSMGTLNFLEKTTVRRGSM